MNKRKDAPLGGAKIKKKKKKKVTFQRKIKTFKLNSCQLNFFEFFVNFYDGIQM